MELTKEDLELVVQVFEELERTQGLRCDEYELLNDIKDEIGV